MLVHWPAIEWLEGRRDLAGLESFRRVASQTATEFVDLAGDLESIHPSLPDLYRDSVHGTPAGHAWIARRLTPRALLWIEETRGENGRSSPASP
ncbi:MAG: hypothetical protein ACREQQ_19050 [Candidatus Binatia bacterium]